MSRCVNIIMYHYVREIYNSPYPGIHGLEYRDFVRQLEHLNKHYTFVSMEDILEAEETRQNLPDNAVHLSFDDGYHDHYQYVFPVLKNMGIQGSFYVPTAILTEGKVLDVNKIHFILERNQADKLLRELQYRIGKLNKTGEVRETFENLFATYAVANRWDSKETIFVKRVLQNGLPREIRNQMTTELFEQSVGKQEDSFAKELYLNLDQMQEMRKENQFFGIHGHNHEHLGKIPLDEAKVDIQKSLEFYQGKNILLNQQWVMNYPYGSVNQELLDAMEGLGCGLGLSVEARTANLDTDPKMMLPRFDTNDYWPRGKR